MKRGLQHREGTWAFVCVRTLDSRGLFSDIRDMHATSDRLLLSHLRLIATGAETHSPTFCSETEARGLLHGQHWKTNETVSTVRLERISNFMLLFKNYKRECCDTPTLPRITPVQYPYRLDPLPCPTYGNNGSWRRFPLTRNHATRWWRRRR